MELVLNRSSTIERDSQLVRRVGAGSEDALRELYDLHGQRLFAYALRVTGRPDLAEEAVQECLVAVWQGAARFRGEGRVIAWLLGIVHHKALNQMRGRIVELLEDNPAESRADGPGVDEQAARHEQSRMVRRGLEGLPLEQRLALELVFYQGLTLNEVAEVSGCPVGTVKSRLNTAKTALRGALSRSGLKAEDVEG